MKQRFEDAQIGDLVYCRINGVGIITAIDKSYITAKFNNPVFSRSYNILWFYTLAGKYSKNSAEPTLYYRDETSNYLEKRPKRKVPWDKVPVNTKVLVSIHGSELYKRYFHTYINTISLPYRCFDDGATSWSSINLKSIGWDHCELAEEVIIEGVIYYPGEN